jgi:hypothetical protein
MRNIVYVPPERRRHSLSPRLDERNFWCANNAMEAQRLVTFLRDLGHERARTISQQEFEAVMRGEEI